MPDEITDALTGVSSLSLAVAEWIIDPRKVMLSEFPPFSIFLRRFIVCPLFDLFGARLGFTRLNQTDIELLHAAKQPSRTSIYELVISKPNALRKSMSSGIA